MIKNKFPKHEKLKSKKVINLLFKDGKIIKKYPLKVIYMPFKFDDSKIKIGVSVSKKLFKKAVDRNRIKRQLRELYRNNKILFQNKSESFCLFIIYISSKPLIYRELEDKFKKIILEINFN